MVHIFFTAILLSSCADIAADVVMSSIPKALAQVALVETLTHEIGAPKQSIIAETELKTNRLESINSIALLTIPDPPYYFFGEGGTGEFSHLFYPIADVAERSAYGEDTAEYGEFSFGKTSQSFLKQFLEENNYEVFEYTVNRGNIFGLVDDYESLDIKGIDAYLDVAPVLIGYKEQQFSTSSESRPYALVVARLVTANTNEVIYAGSIQYGWNPNLSAAGIKIESPEDHKYATKEDLKANKEQAITRLMQGIEVVSLNIAKKISKDEFVSVLSMNTAGGNNAGESILGVNQSITKSSNEASEPEGKINCHDISGTYVSNISGNTQALHLKESEPKVTIVQDGSSISGTFGVSGGKIWGVLKDNTIEFDWVSSRGDSGKGKWIVDPESNVIVGTWYSLWIGNGEWNLMRVE